PVNQKQAAGAAQAFLAGRPLAMERDLSYTLAGMAETRSMDGKALLYVFNLQPSGWMIVSGSDAAFPVPAYSYEGSWSPGQVPEAMQLWLGSYEAQIFDALANNGRDAAHPAWEQLRQANSGPSEGSRGVLPLLTSNWDQGYPYNQQCPADPGGVAGHAVTGCVATACAQLMYYFRHPRHGTGSYTYYHPLYDTISMDFSAATYEWEAMTDQTSVYNEEIAEISYHFGVAVDMVYGPSSSGMYNHKAAYALRTHFGYSPETEYVFRDTTTMSWDSLLLSHIDRKIPMYYAGWAAPGSQSGHAFIADGYEVTPQGKHYHFNWGWGGTLNGYFYTNNLTPGGSQFSFMQELIVNAYPDTLS
ncbi:MAG: C10 family peptidase, partial [Bacteroidales bacterium]|nr:C10 family peptidase [Bacteroidales bacterium]